MVVPEPAACLCLGRREPKGLRPCRADQRFAAALEDRAGYVDMDAGPRGLFVLDSPGARIITLGFDGAVRDHRPAPVGAYALARGHGGTWVAAWLEPRLWWLPDKGAPQAIARAAPVRAMRYDRRRKILWAVGPHPAPVRRQRGPIEGLYDVLDGYRLEPRGPRLQHRTDLRHAALVDAAALELWQERVVVIATGSRAVGLFDPERGTLVRVPVGLTPTAAVPMRKQLAVVQRLDDTVAVVETGRVVDTLALTETLDFRLADWGEVLFYDKVLWSNRDAFTCNSCHWNESSDHRQHPGFMGRRTELNRPVAGTGMIAPLFTPMQAPTLAVAVRGFFDALDSRWYTGAEVPRAPISMTVRGRRHSLSRDRAERALLHFLMTRPVERGPWRRPDGTFDDRATAGAGLFIRDCVRCHEASDDMRRRRTIAPEALLSTLAERPLVFGAPLRVRTGIRPMFHPDGNRISPLLELSRGGPYFSNASAPTLDDVLRMTNPGAVEVHSPQHRTVPFYDRQARRQLVAFLLAL